jgi:polar amino acid transport system substrate-binding protein
MNVPVRKLAKAAAWMGCLALLASLQAVAAPAIKLPASVAAKKQVTVGVNAIFPPMEFKNPGSDDLTGFDVELAQAIGKTLGVKVVFDDQKFDQLLPSVTTGRVDFVISGLSDTAVRRKTFDFIDYFTSGTVAYTDAKNAKDLNSLEALSGKTLAVSAATDYLTTMQAWSKDNLEAKGKPGITILPVDSEATARLQIVQGRAQASAISPEVFGWLEKQNPGQFHAFGPILAPDPYGIVFKKDNSELRDAVLAALKAMVKDGTYKKVLAKWELTRSGVAEPLVNGEPR